MLCTKNECSRGLNYLLRNFSRFVVNFHVAQFEVCTVRDHLIIYAKICDIYQQVNFHFSHGSHGSGEMIEVSRSSEDLDL